MVSDWPDDWDCVNELIIYSNWCKKELPKVIPNCRSDRIILDLTDVVSFKPSIVSYGPYRFLTQILDNNDYILTTMDIITLDTIILKYLITNAILNSSVVYRNQGYNETNMKSLIELMNHKRAKELLIKTDNMTTEIMYHYWKRLKNILDINITNYFKIPTDNIYELFNQHGIIGINSPDELFNLIAREGVLDYDSIKELEWIDKILIVPEVPLVISNHDEVISVKLEVTIYKAGYIADENI